MNSLRTVAIHEAGHAVIAAALGIKVEGIALDSNSGRVRTRCPEQNISEIERSLIVTLAGPIAERLLIGDPSDESVFRGDRKDEIELTAKMAEQVGLFEADLRALDCERRATSLVFAKRKEIQILADRLMLKKVA